MDDRRSRRDRHSSGVPRSRRAFLGAVGAATLGGLAGCTATEPGTPGPPGHIDAADTPPATVAETMFRRDLDRLGVFPDETVPESVTTEWTLREVNTGDHTAAKASPVATPDGDLVVAGDTGEVWRVTTGGEVLWTAAVDETRRGIHGTPALANNTVYVGAYDGALYAFDLATGERFWKTQLGDAIGSSPAYHDGTVYIAVEFHEPSGAMYAADAVTGEVVWSDHRPTHHPHSTCAIDREAGRLVVGSNDTYLYAWTYPGLEFDWKFDTGGPIKGPVATYDGSVFAGTWDYNVYRVDLESGEEEWHAETGRELMAGPAVEPATETLYIGSYDDYLYAFDLESGAEEWSYYLGGAVVGCPTVAGDHVVVGSDNGQVHAVEKESGDGTWTVETVGAASGTPLVYDGAVYTTDRAAQSYVEARWGTDAADPATLDEDRTGALYKLGPAE